MILNFEINHEMWLDCDEGLPEAFEKYLTDYLAKLVECKAATDLRKIITDILIKEVIRLADEGYLSKENGKLVFKNPNLPS